MKIIGISHDMFISSAALIEDGKVIAGGAEERFTREKRTRKFPQKAIQYCLEAANCTIEDIDYFAASWNPGVYFQSFNPLFSNRRRHQAEYLYSVPDHIMSLFPAEKREANYVRQELELFGSRCVIYHLTHHRAHAANGFLLSGFDEAAILTADAQGEFETTTWGKGSGNQIEVFDSVHYPHSMGGFYSTLTEYLGFRPNSDEWKVMALASYADSQNDYYKFLKEHAIKLLPEGKYELNLNLFNGYNREQPHLYTQKLVEALGPAYESGAPMDDRLTSIASAMQAVSEEVALHMLDWLHKKTGSKNVVVSGGFFMNSVFNGKIVSESAFENCFISSCPDDSGNAIGAALYLYNHVLEHKPRFKMEHNYYGPEFTNEAIKETLDKFGQEAEFIEDIASHGAQLLVDGALVGWFQGRMEFGQRALGARSILADPRDEETKNKVNLAVKYREAFRPFAPAVLEDRAAEFFELEPGVSVPFMERVYPIRPEHRDNLGAVCHVDGSGRLQTVSREHNPRYYDLIAAFGELTGVPIVLNTSFNLNGEPVVCTPADAVRTFHSCGLDALILGNYVIRKKR